VPLNEAHQRLDGCVPRSVAVQLASRSESAWVAPVRSKPPPLRPNTGSLGQGGRPIGTQQRRCNGSPLLRIAPVTRDSSLARRASTTAYAKRLRHRLRDQVVAPLGTTWKWGEQSLHQSPEAHGAGLPTGLPQRTSIGTLALQPRQDRAGVLLAWNPALGSSPVGAPPTRRKQQHGGTCGLPTPQRPDCVWKQHCVPRRNALLLSGERVQRYAGECWSCYCSRSLRGVGRTRPRKEGSVMLSSMFSRSRELTLPTDERQAARPERRVRENEKSPPSARQRHRRRDSRTPATSTRNGGDSGHLSVVNRPAARAGNQTRSPTRRAARPVLDSPLVVPYSRRPAEGNVGVLAARDPASPIVAGGNEPTVRSARV
jgi:hypothetical protein